jgi:hypothetical protein
MQPYLNTLIQKENLTSLSDNDVSIVIGNSLDEFMRHHPTTKTLVFEGLNEMLKRIAEWDAKPEELVLERDLKSDTASVVDVITRVFFHRKWLILVT